jgi:hypothetical protein
MPQTMRRTNTGDIGKERIYFHKIGTTSEFSDLPSAERMVRYFYPIAG